MDVWDRCSGKGVGVRLLEDETEGVQREALTGGKVSVPTTEGRPDTTTQAKGEEKDEARAKPTLPPVGKPLSTTRLRPSGPSTQDANPLTDTKDMSTLTTQMMGSLTIRERPTPTTAPIAPSLHPPTPTPPHDPESSTTSTDSSGTSTTTRRAGASLVSTPAKLSSNFLQASRQMGPVPQLPPDPEDEDDPYGDEEAEMGLGWGQEDDETRRLFDEAQRAMEMEQAEEEDGE